MRGEAAFRECFRRGALLVELDAARLWLSSEPEARFQSEERTSEQEDESEAEALRKGDKARALEASHF